MDWFDKKDLYKVNDVRTLKEALSIALDYFDRVAGPPGCGIELNTPKHFAFQYRECIHTILIGEESDDTTKD